MTFRTKAEICKVETRLRAALRKYRSNFIGIDPHDPAEQVPRCRREFHRMEGFLFALWWVQGHKHGPPSVASLRRAWIEAKR